MYVFKRIFEETVKSTFLNGILEEEVYLEQLEGFVDENNKDGEGQKEKPQPMDVNGKTYIKREILLKE